MSEREFEVGDVCRIREWDDMLKEFGTDVDGDINIRPSFTSYMKHLCGELFTIASKSSLYMGEYTSEEGVESKWAISADMLELAADVDIDAEDLVELLNM